METYTLTLDQDQIDQLLNTYPHSKDPKNPYILAHVYCDDATINIYTSKKTVIQGKKAQSYYQSLNKEKENTIILPQAGSDEVGTGDFFGPIVVCAVYIDKDIYQKIKAYHLDDSKKINDEYILKNTPYILKEVKYSLLILDNKKYNQVIAKYNMNAIKAILHNQAYVHLQNKGVTLPETTVIDQFCIESSYYKYLIGQPKIVKGIKFQTKAESSFVAVATASMIARYTFLTYMQEMNKNYGISFPKGASDQCEKTAKEFIDKYGKEKLAEVSKLNFKNYERILQENIF